MLNKNRRGLVVRRVPLVPLVQEAMRLRKDVSRVSVHDTRYGYVERLETGMVGPDDDGQSLMPDRVGGLGRWARSSSIRSSEEFDALLECHWWANNGCRCRIHSTYSIYCGRQLGVINGIAFEMFRWKPWP